MNSLILRPPSRYQDPNELRRFIEFCVERDVRSYLEIGSRWGDSFFAVMMNLKPGSSGMAIDLPESDGKRRSVEATIIEVRAAGQKAVALFGSSRNAEIRRAAASCGPFDLVFIDGDHTYEGARADWADYHAMAKYVALHDVAAPDDWLADGKPCGVGKLWRELKGLTTKVLHDGVVVEEIPVFKETIEFSTPGANMGYGIVVR